MPTTLITGPTVEPVTLAEAKAHLNLSDFGSPLSHPDDTMITSLIQVAREHAEEYTRRVFITQTWDYKIDNFKSSIEIPKPNLISVTSVKYIDTDGVEQTASTDLYVVDTDSVPGRVYLDYGKAWPIARNQRLAVTIRFVAGYEDSGASPQVLDDNVPQAIKQAMLLHIGHLYEHRESKADFPIHDTMAYQNLLQPYKILHL